MTNYTYSYLILSKVPRSKAPVESNFHTTQRHGYRGYVDSDASSSIMNYNNHQRTGASPAGRNQFNSTRLVKNAENHRRHSGPGIPPGQHGSRELDREGRMIRSIRASHSANEPANGGLTNGRLRNYSGHSTSPERGNASPDRYSKPRSTMTARSYSNSGHHPQNIINRSPSTSPTRPPRSRSSPTREIIHNGVRRVASRRGDVDRSPSAAGRNSALGMNNKRAQNGYRHGSGDRDHGNMNGHPQRPERRERSNDGRRSAMSSFNAPPRAHHQNTAVKQQRDAGEDRLARFTEYRGDDVVDHQQQPAQPRRPSIKPSYAGEGSVSDRERGQSLPPGATIDSIGDFYKSSQYKSMYALPPSPSRPAPVLDRSDRTVSSSTLGAAHRREGSGGRMADRPPGPPPANSATSRLSGRPGSRQHHVSISEGDVTDSDAMVRGGQIDKMGRPRSRVTGSPVSHTMRPKRQAPSPPGRQPGIVTNGLLHGVGRRFISSDNKELRSTSAMDHTGGGRRVASNERSGSGLIHPPTRRVVVGRRPSDGLDSSYSESEGINGEADQVGPYPYKYSSTIATF